MKNDFFLVPCEPSYYEYYDYETMENFPDYDFVFIAEGLCKEDTKLALSDNLNCLYEVYKFPGRKMGFDKHT